MLVAKIILKCIKEHLESLIGREQHGFCLAFSCIVHINTFLIIVEQMCGV